MTTTLSGTTYIAIEVPAPCVGSSASATRAEDVDPPRGLDAKVIEGGNEVFESIFSNDEQTGAQGAFDAIPHFLVLQNAGDEFLIAHVDQRESIDGEGSDLAAPATDRRLEPVWDPLDGPLAKHFKDL